MIAVGLCGLPGTGKDVAGAELVERYGFTRYAVGDQLKVQAYALDPMVLTSRGSGDTHRHACRLQVVVDSMGWDRAKQLPDVRRMLQRLGKEAGPDLYGDTYWVDRTLAQVARDGAERVVFTGVRHHAEVEAMRAMGAVIICIERPGVERPTGLADHSAEALDWHIDHTVANDGSPETLGDKIAALAGVTG